MTINWRLLQQILYYIAQWSNAFTKHGVIGEIFFVKKKFDNFLSFQATEMVLTHTSKLGRIQPEIQIQADQAACELEWSLKPLEVSRDALLRAEISYDPLVARSGM